MELKFAILADWINETREGKANIIGEFDRIRAPQVPVVHQHLALIARFEAKVSEGTQHAFRFGLYDEDGAEVMPLSPEVPLEFVSTGRGKPFRGNMIVNVGGLSLPKYGDYEFHLLVDGRHMASITFSLIQLDEL